MAKTRIPLNPEWQIVLRRKELLNSAIAELDLDQRTVNGLEQYGVVFVSQLIQLTTGDLLSFKNFGEKSVQRIVDVLSEHGVELENGPAKCKSSLGPHAR